jgi:uncharacterized protein YbaR (Trm112 family)
MFVSHFSSLRPVCPNCRARGKGVGLRLAVVEEQQGDDVVSGIVSCDACGAEYPVIDGLPIPFPTSAAMFRTISIIFSPATTCRRRWKA